MLDAQKASVTCLCSVFRVNPLDDVQKTVRKTEKRCALAPKPQRFPADFIGTWTLMLLSAAIRFKHNQKKNNRKSRRRKDLQRSNWVDQPRTSDIQSATTPKILPPSS